MVLIGQLREKFLNIYIFILRNNLGAREMAQWVKVLAANTDGLHFIPRIHRVERESQLLKVVLCFPQACTRQCSYTYIQ